MNPGDLVPISFHGGLLLLSFLIAVFGSYVALLAAAGIRADLHEGDIQIGYVVVAALAMGGVGIWSMHFIGIQAQVMPFDVYFQVGLTVLSFVLAVGFSGLAFWYVARTRFSMARCLVGGVLAGIGVVAMHYVGMAAMRMPALIIWNLPLVLASVFIAILAATAALWLAFNTQNVGQRMAAAVLMAIAVCGMHYTGAAAGGIVCMTPRENYSLQIGGVSLPYLAFFLSVITLLVLRWQLQRASNRFRQRSAARMDAFIESGSVTDAKKA